MEEYNYSKEMIDFIYNSPTAFHAVDSSKNMLLEAGYEELFENEKWHLKKGGKYFVSKNLSALIAFKIGEGDILKEGYKIIAAHTDSPSFRIKPSPEIISEKSYLKVNTEVYGSPIISTWLDRPLALAGRVVLRDSNNSRPQVKLININKPLLVIPNLSIHMNRNINEGSPINKQNDILPLLSVLNEDFNKENCILKLIAKELSVREEDILDFDLFLYEYEKGKIIGINNEFISSGRLDDLSMVFASLKAICSEMDFKGIGVMVAFDNEEVGSSTKQGAGSPFLSHILERIMLSFNRSKEEYFIALSSSIMISADLAHAVHPNFPGKADPTNRPIINKGPVIKISANQSYTTDSYSSSIYKLICEKAKVCPQYFVNRSDERGGSTIGPILSKHLDINSIDMGAPVLAMHSIRELAGVLDQLMVFNSFKEFYRF